MSYMPHNSQHERDGAATLVDLLLADGCTVSVNDGEEWTVKRSKDRAAILAALGSTDNDGIRWRTAGGELIGTFWLVYGNGRGELIADHTYNPACEAVWQRYANLHPHN